MSTSRRARLDAGLSTPNRPHPVLSALQFVDQTNEIPPDGGTQGASLNVKNGRLLHAGKADVWMVGGHRRSDGSKIEAEHVPGRALTPLQGLNHVMRVRRETADQQQPVAAGSWYSKERGEIDLDASTPVAEREDAVSLMKARNEDAIFHLKSFEELSNSARPRR